MEQPANSPQENEFKEWLLHPTTRRLHEWLRSKQASWKDQWAAGAFTDVHEYATAILNAKAIGNCQMVDSVLNIELSDLYEEMEYGRRPE